jgi:hypothetical protein
MRKTWMDENYDKDRNVVDLTFIGNDNTSNEEENYICEFCNVALIEKLDDMAHLGMNYNRLICSKCGLIYDMKKEGDIDNVKHAESIHTLTDSNSEEPYIECIGQSSNDLLETEEDPLDNFDNNEVQELKNQGMIIKDVFTITRSSVNGRIKEEYLEVLLFCNYS